MKTLSSWVLGVLLFILILTGSAVIILWVTVKGIGITVDSTIYLSTAKSLLEGNGFFAFGEPMTHYPPVYPLILYAAGVFNPDITVSARFLHAILYGLNGFLFILIAYTVTNCSLFALLAAAILYFSNEYLLDIHAYAWSEAPFITFMLLTVLCFIKYTSTQKLKWMYLSAIAMSLAVGTRYVGITLVPAVIVAYYIFSDLQIKKRIKHALIISAISVTPLSIWLIRNLIIADTAVHRTLAYHPIDADSYQGLISSLHNFILPSTLTWWNNALELAVILGIMTIFTVRLFRFFLRDDRNERDALALAFLGLIAPFVYLVFLVFSKTYIDALTLFNHRLVSPMFIMLSLSAIAILYGYAKLAKNKAAWAVFLLCVLLVGRANLGSTIDAAFFKRANGLGLNAELFHNSPLLKALTGLDSAQVLYSNGYREIGFLTGNTTASLPQKYDAVSKEQNPNYQSQLDAMCEAAKSGKGLIVSLRLLKAWDIYPTEDEIDSACDLPIIYDAYDGFVTGNTEQSILLP